MLVNEVVHMSETLCLASPSLSALPSVWCFIAIPSHPFTVSEQTLSEAITSRGGGG